METFTFNILDIVHTTLNAPGKSSHKPQKLFSQILQNEQGRQVFRKFKQCRTPPDNARLKSCCGSHSGAWLLCVPKDEHSRLGTEAFRFACRLRLGLPMRGSPTFCSLCRKHIDNFAIHPFSCPHQRSRLLEKHDMLVRLFKALARVAGVKFQDHHLTIFLALTENNLLRPDLLLAAMGPNLRDLFIDFVFTDPRSQSNAPQSAVKFGAARDKRERMKINKYRDLCEQLGYSFTAASLEIFGSMTDSLHQLIQQLVQKAAERSNIPYSILFPYWCKRISMTVQRGNAKFFMEASVRMSGSSDSRGDASVMLATHHIRTVAE